MSNVSTPNDSPVHVEPLHNPAHAAQVIVPQAPLGNATNGKFNNHLPGMGAKALLAKKLAKGGNTKYISPTDTMMTPCSQKISAAKKKRFDKGTKPMQQLALQKSEPEEPLELKSDEEKENIMKDTEEDASENDEPISEDTQERAVDITMDDPENPF